MTSRPSLSTLRKQLRALSREPVSDAEIESSVSDMLRERNDRGTALIGKEIIDSTLTGMLRMHFSHLSKEENEQLFDRDNSPLGTFSAKIKIAYALGIISKNERDELDRIRHIRNAFAHTQRPITFETTEIRQMCDYLIYGLPQNVNEKYYSSSPKRRFIKSIKSLISITYDQNQLERALALARMRRQT